MSSKTAKKSNKCLITSEDWDTLRYHFQDSVMATASLCKLAKDMGLKWPIRGTKETPGKYIGHTWETLGELPEFYGKSNRLPLLYTILEDTLALDDPFSDMVSHFDAVTHKEDEALVALKQLEIPTNFPVKLTNFSSDTLNLCKAEQIRTIGSFVEFAHDSTQTVVISGDYQTFLNALVQHDLKGLKEFIPVREGEFGVFLAESLGHLAGQLTDRQAASLLSACQLSSTKAAWNPDNALSKADTLALIAVVKQSVSERMELMPDQAQQLRHAVDSGEAACVRFFISLRDADTETLARAIAMAALDMKPRFKGLIGRPGKGSG